MKRTCLLLSVIALCASQTSHAQGWEWAHQTTFSNTVPFEDNWLQAFSSDRCLYTFACLGSQSGTTLSGVVTHTGALNVTDSFNCVQAILSKIDSNGNYVWNLSTQHSDVGCTNIATDNEGNCYISGVFDSAYVRIGNYTITNPATPNYSTFLAKVGPAGNVVWAKTIVRAYPEGLDDVRFGQGALGTDSRGEVYITGTYTLGTATIGSYTLPTTGTFDNDLYLAKYDSSGNLIWAKSFGNVSGYYLGNNLCVAPGGGLFLSGQYQSSPFVMGTSTLTSPSGYGFFLAHLDSTGTPLWSRNFPGNANDVINGMTTDRNMNIYMTGGFNNDTMLFGTDTLLNTVYGGASSDMFLVKYDSSGNEKWARKAGGTGLDLGFSVAADTFGNVWVVGNMAGGLYTPGYTMFFGSSTDTLSERAGSVDPLYLAHYNSYGTYLSSMSLYSMGDDQCNVLVDNNKNLYVTGDWLTATEVLGPDTVGYTGTYEKAMSAKYNYSLLMGPLQAPAPLPEQRSIALYPNPAAQQCTLVVPGNTGRGVGDLYDITGRWVGSYQLAGEISTLSLAGLQPGLYVLQVAQPGTSTQTLRLVIR